MGTQGLVPASAYDPARQRVVGFVAASLDEQSKTLSKAVADLPVACLEWQPRPGHSTIGMLLAHVAITEAWWILAAPTETLDRDADETIVRAAIGLGLDDDGMPSSLDGRHPAPIRGRSAGEHVAVLARAREAVHAALASWDDAGLEKSVRLRGDRSVTRGWVLYHVLEHLAYHAGQIGRLRHDLRDAGLLPASA